MQALKIYQDLLEQDDPDPLYYTYSAACSYYMGMYQEAEQLALKVNILIWLRFHEAERNGHSHNTDNSSSDNFSDFPDGNLGTICCLRILP